MRTEDDSEDLRGTYQRWAAAAQPQPRWHWMLGLAAASLVGFVGGRLYEGRAAHPTTTAMQSSVPTLASGLPSLLASELPSKFALVGETPNDFQLQRGDCWLFATVSLLEDSYHRQGVAQGFLKPDEYVRFSRQAYGAALLQACKAAPEKCMFDGDAIYTGNSTTGGEVEFTYRLAEALGDAALPMSVCPYQATTQNTHGEFPTTDAKCDGLSAARARNPIHFTVRSLRTLFDRVSIKHALATKNRALVLSVTMIVVPYWLPCTPSTAALYGPGGGAAFGEPTATCATPTACPLERAFAGVDGCLATNRQMYTLKAEWFHRADEPQLIKEGGHAVTLVGYSDTYRTEHGLTGGYIIKNSWEDGLGKSHGAPARGSHSLDYFLQKVSDLDERQICPNVHSPRSWYPCPTRKDCLSKEYGWFARSTRTVLRLQCASSNPVVTGVCEEGERLFLANITGWGGGLHVACFLRAAPQAGQPADLCFPPLWLDDLATSVAPVGEENKPNDPDRCGYYFIPYETFEAATALHGNGWASDLDIQWSASSFAAITNEALEGKDYDLIKRNTKHLPPVVRFPTPQPVMTRDDLTARR